MNINRHNYEEFFLLYVDRELSAADRKAVDVFVQENPDLQVELLLLQQTVVQADDIILDKKDWLFMEAGISALQENLLLYADDELTPADKNAVETLLATDRSAMAEWDILQQTKLEADTTVVFEDKRSLYRTEGGRVVGFKWWRVAAAAVLLGVGLWTGVFVYNNNSRTDSGNGEVTNAGATNPKQVKTGIPANTTTDKTQPDADNTLPNAITVSTEKNEDNKATENGTGTIDKNSKQNTVDQKNSIAVQDNRYKKTDDDLPKTSLRNFNRQERNKTVIASVLPADNNPVNASGVNNGIVKNNMKEKINNAVIAIQENSSKQEQATAVIPVVYDNTTDENSNDRILYMNEDKVKRTALGGFLRKAKRLIERNTNIKTGDGIKVAGFEIALK